MRKLTGKKMTKPPKYTIIFFVIFFDFIARHGRSLQMRTARRLVDIIQFIPLAGDLGFPSVFYRKVELVLSIIFLYKKKMTTISSFFWNTRSFFASAFSSKKKNDAKNDAKNDRVFWALS